MTVFPIELALVQAYGPVVPQVSGKIDYRNLDGAVS
jgi:hypothetical protein